MATITAATIERAQQADEQDPDLLRALANAVERYAKQHRSSADVAAYATVNAAACLPSLTFADGEERARCIAYAAKTAVSRAAADVAREQGDTLSLEALADAEVIIGTEALGNIRPATPRPDAVATITRSDVTAGAVARLVDLRRLDACLAFHTDPIEQRAAAVAVSRLPHAETYALAVGTLIALTTDEQGRALRRRGRPLTLRGALALATGRTSKDRLPAADVAALDAAQQAAHAMLVDAAADPWHVGTGRRTPAHWSEQAQAAARMAGIRQARSDSLPNPPETDVPANGWTAVGAPASAVVTHHTRQGRLSIDGSDVGSTGSGAAWHAALDALSTPQQRTQRPPHACPAEAPIGTAHDPAGDVAPIAPGTHWGASSGIAPVYAACPVCDRTTERRRATERGATHPQRGAVKKPQRRKSAGVGSTGPTQPASPHADAAAIL